MALCVSMTYGRFNILLRERWLPLWVGQAISDYSNNTAFFEKYYKTLFSAVSEQNNCLCTDVKWRKVQFLFGF